LIAAFRWTYDRVVDVRRALDRLIRREARIFAVLCGIAVAGFFVTRTLASSNRKTAREDAARWHAIGETRLREARTTDAVAAFRTASLIDRDDRGHRLALAGALLRAGDHAAALDVLLRLRESVPEDVAVNATLAHLEAARGNVDAAVRYYQAAILALWPPARIDDRRTLRVELIEFLLDHGSPERALAEALKLSGEIPDDPSSHVRAGELLLRAGSPARALDQFRDALRRDPRNAAALAGRRDALAEIAKQPPQEPQ